MTTRMYYDLDSKSNLEVWKDGDNIILEMENCNQEFISMNLDREDLEDLINTLVALKDRIL